MGMDVYGKKPTNQVGEYFRNNVWWWRPLWDYCLDNHGEVTSKVKYGHSNDGDGLNGPDARKLASLLRHDIASGFAEKYEKDYRDMILNFPKEPCTSCNQTGKIKSNQSGGDSVEAQCLRCEGTGSCPNFMSHYPFSVDNLREFADFCYHSGGFQIC